MRLSTTRQTGGCPLTRSEFLANAGHITVVVLDKDGHEIGRRKLLPRQFSTDSVGWNLADRVDMSVLGQTLSVQCGGNFTVVGSKDLPKEAKPAA